jgi:hypothetical protein
MSSKGTPVTLVETLEAKLRADGLSGAALGTKIHDFIAAWWRAHPSFGYEKGYHTGHPLPQYLSLPGHWSAAEGEVLKAFGLLEDHPTPCVEEVGRPSA